MWVADDTKDGSAVSDARPDEWPCPTLFASLVVSSREGVTFHVTGQLIRVLLVLAIPMDCGS